MASLLARLVHRASTVLANLALFSITVSKISALNWSCAMPTLDFG